MNPLDNNAEITQQSATNRLEYFPITFFAVILGLCGLTLVLLALGLHSLFFLSLGITIVVFLTLCSLYLLKFLRYPKAVQAEWVHPIKLAFFPAISLSILLIATALREVDITVAKNLWLIGLLAQSIFTISVLSNWIGHRSFQHVHVSPAWFIPAVGNVIVPVSGVSFGFPEISMLFFSGGMLFWLVLLVIVMNRLMFHDPLPGKFVPTLAILIAPPALGFMAWLQLNGGVLDYFAQFLISIAFIFFILAITQIRLLKDVPFALSWWALTFPIAAFGMATLRYYSFMKTDSYLYFAYGIMALLFLIEAVLIYLTLKAILKKTICQPE